MTNLEQRAVLMGKPAGFGSTPQPIVRQGPTDPIVAQAQKVQLMGGRFDLRDTRFHRMLARLILGD